MTQSPPWLFYLRKVLCCLALLAWCILPAFSKGTPQEAVFDLEAIVERGTLRVGTTGDYPPFTYHPAESQTYQGFDIAMAKSLGRFLHVTVVFVPTTWATFTTDLQAHRFDIAMGGISHTRARTAFVDFSVPYLADGKVPIARCDSPHPLNTLQEIDQHTITVIENKGGTNEAFAKRHFRHATLLIVKDNTTVFDHLLNHHADVMITDKSEALYQQRQHPELCTRHPDTPFTHTVKAYALPKNAPLLKEQVNLWLDDLKNTPRFNQLKQTWFHPPATP